MADVPHDGNSAPMPDMTRRSYEGDAGWRDLLASDRQRSHHWFGPSSANATAASTFMLPAPGPDQPRDGMNELVSCSTAFASAGVSVRLLLKQQRHRAAHHPRRHARPRQLHVGVGPLPVTCRSGIRLSTDTRPGASADTMWLPGRHQSGFITRSYSVGPRELYVATVSSRPLRRARACRSRPTVIAHGLLPGDVMPPIHRPAVRRLPEIARRRDDDDAGPDRPLHRLAHRIVAVRLQHRRAERQVDDAGCCTRARCSIAQSIASITSLAVAGAVGAEHAQVDQVRARRDAAVVARLGRPPGLRRR